MGQISIKIQNKEEHYLAVSHGEDEAHLVYAARYEEGDRISVEIGGRTGFYWLQLDDARGSSLVYLTGDVSYEIPFGSRRVHLSPNTFAGTLHLLTVRRARPWETGYRNLAKNLWDQHGETHCFPHASANVETRGEAVFAAMNAIDGVTVSGCHGEWPYASWGINRREDAVFRLDFGRRVYTDRLIVYTRADFPHDSWWTGGTVTFSDGSTLSLELGKTGAAQEFLFEEREITWLELSGLQKADDPSPFPALVQLEVYGRETEV